MRIRTFLRPLRGGRPLAAACAATGLAGGELLMFERGHSIPHDDQASRMEAFYGPRELWYPATVHRAIAGDLGDCEACGDELDPHLRRGVRFHPECSRRPTAGVGSLPERTAGAAPAAPAVLLSQGA